MTVVIVNRNHFDFEFKSCQSNIFENTGWFFRTVQKYLYSQPAELELGLGLAWQKDMVRMLWNEMMICLNLAIKTN